MHDYPVPVIGFAAPSGSGKTTLLTQLIPLLRQRGLRVGLIKHSHHDFAIDQPGKDSQRLRQAGASPVLLVSKFRRAVITELDGIREPLLHEQLQYLDPAQLDLILVEGFKHESFPKIEVHRAALNTHPLYPTDASIFAVAADTPLPAPGNVTLLDLNKPAAIADFIYRVFLERAHA